MRSADDGVRVRARVRVRAVRAHVLVHVHEAQTTECEYELTVIAIATALITGLAVRCDAQAIKKGTLSGRIKTGSANGDPVPGTLVAIDASAAPVTLPGGAEVLVVTQFCWDRAPGGNIQLLDGNNVAFQSPLESGCEQFTPGIVITQGNDVRCNSVALYRCLVTGIVTK